MKNKFFVLFLFSFLSSAATYAQVIASGKTIQINLAQTGLQENDVEVVVSMYCKYQKEVIDFPFFKKQLRDISCGDFQKKLEVKNGTVTLPDLKYFNGREGEKIENYGLQIEINQIKADLQDQILLRMNAFKNEIADLYAQALDMSFEKIELKDVRVKYNGIDAFEQALFKNGDSSMVVFYKNSQKFTYVMDYHLTRRFSHTKSVKSFFANGFMNLGPYYQVQFTHQPQNTGTLYAHIHGADGKYYVNKMETETSDSALKQIHTINLELEK